MEKIKIYDGSKNAEKYVSYINNFKPYFQKFKEAYLKFAGPIGGEWGKETAEIAIGQALAAHVDDLIVKFIESQNVYLRPAVDKELSKHKDLYDHEWHVFCQAANRMNQGLYNFNIDINIPLNNKGEIEITSAYEESIKSEFDIFMETEQEHERYQAIVDFVKGWDNLEAHFGNKGSSWLLDAMKSRNADFKFKLVVPNIANISSLLKNGGK